MKFSLFTITTIVASTLSVRAGRSSEVKLVRAKPLIINPEYYTYRLFTVIEGNQTYNSLGMSYDRKKDLPVDVESHVQVFRSDSKLTKADYQLIRDLSFLLCANETGKYDAYLTDWLLQSRKSGKCVKKGRMTTTNAGYFRFYELLSEEELKNANFIFVRTYSYSGKIINSDELDFVSN